MLIKVYEDMEYGDRVIPAGSILKIEIEDGYFKLEETSLQESYWDMEFDNLRDDTLRFP